MTPQEAIQFLVDVHGYSQAEAETLVASLPTTPPARGGSILVNPEALEAATQTPEERAKAEADRVEAKETLEAEEVAESLSLLDSYTAKTQSSDPTVQASVTKEEQEAFDEANPEERGSAIDRLVAALGEDDALNYNWVYQFLEVGSLDSNEALIGFYEAYAEINEIPEPLTDEDEILAKARDLLVRGSNNILVQDAVEEWGDSTGNYLPNQTFDGVSAIDIAQMKERFGISRNRAITIGKVANRHDLDAMDLAALWDNYDISKLVGQTEATTELEQIAGELRDFRLVRRGLSDIAMLYKKGLTMYDQSHVLAAISIQDANLAERLRNDPYSLDSLELKKALEYAGDVGPEDAQANWLRTRLAGGFRADAPVDKEAMRNAVQVLADGWNLTGSEAVVGQLTSELVSQAIAQAQATLPNPFGPLAEGVGLRDVIQDRAAHVKRRLRETQEYKELFNQKAEGESEEEFVRRFENRSQQVLGDDVTGVVRNAMRSGNVNAVFQQGLNTSVGDSSTRFQEIIARNAQTFRDLL